MKPNNKDFDDFYHHQWPILVRLLKRINREKSLKLSEQETSIISLLEEKKPPACNTDCKDFNARGLPFDFDTRLIAYVTTNPAFHEEDRSLLLNAVMRYNPAQGEPLEKLTVHVFKEFRKALTAPIYELEDKIHRLTQRIQNLIKEIDEKENHSKKLFEEIAYMTSSMQEILKQSIGKVSATQVEILKAFDQELPKDQIIDIIKKQNRQIIEYLQEEAQKASVDALTGLMNRGTFDRFIQETQSICKDENTPLTLMMIDIDHFKQINDSYGHIVGDDVLKFISQQGIYIFAKRFNSAATARYGGEKFMIVLPGIELKKAKSIAETIRSAIEKEPFEFIMNKAIKRINVTVSIGVSELKPESADAKLLIDNAQKALMKAKNSGRNKVCTL